MVFVACTFPFKLPYPLDVSVEGIDETDGVGIGSAGAGVKKNAVAVAFNGFDLVTGAVDGTVDVEVDVDDVAGVDAKIASFALSFDEEGVVGFVLVFDTRTGDWTEVLI
jgi:hypothetical protein